jgi:secondary thiamine-phosphate synthase enzyme
MIQQIEFSLPAHSRGYHLVTKAISAKLPKLPQTGICHLFIKHTSAALTINENADPSVRVDFESVFNKIVPENQPFLTHTMEGPDDMPAHIKAAMIGSSISIPISNYQLNLGTWQGIYLCEFRNYGGRRKLVATIYG